MGISRCKQCGDVIDHIPGRDRDDELCDQCARDQGQEHTHA